MKTPYVRSLCIVVSLSVLFCFAAPGRAADSAQAVGEQIGAAVDSAKTSIEDASKAAANKIEQLWQRIDESRLKNRTRDEIVAWVIMGLLVGAFAGLLSVLRTSAFQRFWTVVLGLIGALIGGVAAHVAQLDFGMGPILVRYEDLVLSLAGGLVLIAVVRFIGARRRKTV